MYSHEIIVYISAGYQYTVFSELPMKKVIQNARMLEIDLATSFHLDDLLQIFKIVLKSDSDTCKYYFSNMFPSTLAPGKMANTIARQATILKV
jgi:hypothetical protein